MTGVYLLLANGLLVAYLSKVVSVLGYFSGGALSPEATAAGFVAAAVAFMVCGGTRAADALNQGLTSLLLVLFVGILGAGAAQGGPDMPAALAAQPAAWAALAPAMPIVFLSLVYHDLVPVIVSYLGGDRGRVRQAIVFGSLLPLGMFLAWEAVALGLLPAGLAAPAAVMEASLQLGSGGGAGGAATFVADTARAIAVDPLEVRAGG